MKFVIILHVQYIELNRSQEPKQFWQKYALSICLLLLYKICFALLLKLINQSLQHCPTPNHRDNLISHHCAKNSPTLFP